MEKPKTTPKDFFLWAGAMIAIYSGVVAIITLLFQYINYTFPDPLVYYSDPYSSPIPYAMASLIVLTPVFLILMRVIRRNIAADPTRADIWVRRWALFLTVFVAGVTIVVDLIVLLTTFLSGESLTIAFLLKVLVVLLVAGAGFMHFLADLWGYWVKNPAKARYVNYATGVAVVLAIVAGFFIVGTPQEARLMRFDQEKVYALQNIQSQLVGYWQTKQALPPTLEELNDPLYGITVPVDPQTGEEYRYERTSQSSFRLCATFNAVSRPMPTGYTEPYRYMGDQNWEHGMGEVCFDRTIDPERYPPYTKSVF
ncbi:MAG: DUF5671 domain-containing protein [Candidatus Adlerbacteria bacterium]|nr:DUF5671 domain-containing protein [Candidatus Adlerbacteria bacterium]